MRFVTLLLITLGGLGFAQVSAEEPASSQATTADQAATEPELDAPSGHMNFTVGEFEALPKVLQNRIIALEELQAYLQEEQDELISKYDEPSDAQVKEVMQKMEEKNGGDMRKAGREEAAIRKAIDDLPWNNPASPKSKLPPEVRAVLGKIKVLGDEYRDLRHSYPGRFAAAKTEEEKQQVTADQEKQENALRIQIKELENEGERLMKLATKDPSVTGLPTE